MSSQRKSISIITGATSGIGYELAKIHASKGFNLLLVSRSESELQKIQYNFQQQFKVEIHFLALDLSRLNAAQTVFEYVENNRWQVDYLFNNAGFGGMGEFLSRATQDDQEMNLLNMLAVHELMHLFLPQMVERKSGFILNTASTAGFMPGPNQANYFATKAYVVSLTEAVAHEYLNSGVTISALCPGPVKTKFGERAGMSHLNVFEKAVSAEWIAKKAYHSLHRGKTIIIPEFTFRFLIHFVLPFLPRTLLLRTIKGLQKVEK